MKRFRDFQVLRILRSSFPIAALHDWLGRKSDQGPSALLPIAWKEGQKIEKAFNLDQGYEDIYMNMNMNMNIIRIYLSSVYTHACAKSHAPSITSVEPVTYWLTAKLSTACA